MRDLNDVRWKKSSQSGAYNNCVEVAALDSGRAVRDSKNPTGPALRCTTPGWSAFTAGVKSGEFD
ncbi:MAG: DUF397 domain-containing protein [Pseudonocardiales bacterium]|nr:DUF397 domain-containing protein [Pseudonocardiales bacterium]MBW0010484.1 DUF397 domain-containing protein [Pseudonocardiales bacterium]